MRISVKLAIIYMLILFVSWMMIFFLFAGIRSRESRNYAKALLAQTLNTVGRNVTTIIDNAAYYSRIILSSNEIAEMDLQAEETMPYWEFYLGGKRAENFMRASGKLYRKEISAEEFAESLSR